MVNFRYSTHDAEPKEVIVHRIRIIMAVVLTFTASGRCEEPVFSGPQVGERLAPFEAQIVFGDDKGKTVPVLEGIEDAPTLLIFAHQVTRPSVGLIRLLADFAQTKKDDGIHTRLVFLTEDPTDTAAWFRRARRALPASVSPMISLDGIEGPGVYGLNRKMTLTVLVANKGKVTANYALIQPSIQADATKIGHAIVKTLGVDSEPTLKEMGFKDRQMRMRASSESPEHEGIYRGMMAPVIRKTATDEEVAVAAKKVEEFAEKNLWFRARVHKAANLIIDGGKLSNYGTEAAQAYLKKWSTEFATVAPNKKTTNPPTADSK